MEFFLIRDSFIFQEELFCSFFENWMQIHKIEKLNAEGHKNGWQVNISQLLFVVKKAERKQH